MRAFSEYHRSGSTQKDDQIHPRRPGLRITQIQTHHFVKGHFASSSYLPKSGNSRLRFENAVAVPNVISFHFVCDRWAGSYQRHFASQYVDELRKLIETCTPQESSDFGDPRIIGHLENCFAIPRSLRFRLPCNQLPDVFLMDAGIIINVHGPEFQKYKRLTILANSFLFEKNRTFRCQLDGRRNEQEHWSKQD